MIHEFQFRLGDGLYMDDRLLAEFNPQVTCKNIYIDLKSGEENVLYRITATDLNGAQGVEIEVPDFSNISYFKIWGYPDGHLSRFDRAWLMYKLQFEAQKVPVKRIPVLNPGLQFCNERPLLVLGELVVGDDTIVEEMVVHEPAGSLQITELGIREIDHIRDYMMLLPGITEILFYGSMFAILKPFLNYWGFKTDFLLAVVGPSGHLKTTLTSLYALWLKEAEKQTITFRNKFRTETLMKRISDCAGLNFLMDDLHQAASYYRKAKQGDQLDMIVRNMSDTLCNTNIWVTGESMKDIDIFSCRDRMLQIRIPKMNSENINRLKAKISILDKAVMSKEAIRFAGALIKNIDEVHKDIVSYYKNYGIPENDDSPIPTRIYYHGMFIRMTEFLYNKYICSGCQEQSGQKELDAALNKQGKFQKQELQMLRRQDEESDYVIEVFEMLNADAKYLIAVTEQQKYQPERAGREFLIWNNNYYIKRTVLQEGLMEYLGRTFSINNVIVALDNAGVLDKEKGVTSKHFKGIRHLVISSPLIKKYYEMKKDEEKWNID